MAVHHYRHAARDLHQFGIADPERLGDDNLVARIEYGLADVEQRMLCAVGYDDLIRLVFKAIIALKLFTYRRAQLQRAAGRSVARHALIQSRLCGVAYVLGRIEIRFARTESNDVNALFLHSLRLGIYNKRGRRRDTPATI